MEQEPPKTLWERVCPHNVGAALGIDMAPYLLNRRKDLLENLPPGAVTFKATDLAMPIKSGALLPTDVPGEYQLHGSDVKLTKLPCVRHVGTIEEMEKAIDFAEKNNWVSFVLRLRKPSTETFNGKPMTASGDPACDVLHDVFVGKCRTHRPGGPGAKLPVQFLEVYDTDPIANAKEQFPSLSYALPWNFRKGKMTPVRVDPAVVSPESEGFKGCMRDTVARMKKLRPDEWDETSGPERVKMICGRSMYLDFVDLQMNDHVDRSVRLLRAGGTRPVELLRSLTSKSMSDGSIDAARDSIEQTVRVRNMENRDALLAQAVSKTFAASK